jgi:phosphoglycerate kinase
VNCILIGYGKLVGIFSFGCIVNLYPLLVLWFQELDYLVGAIANPKRPFAAIVGGSKVSSKIGVIESLLEKVNLLLLGGGMIYTFYKAQGYSVGSSLVEEDKLDLAKSLMEKAKSKGVSLLLPTDVVIADKFAPDANSKVKSHLFYKF